jgi:coproporphyrinogen III oxidase-like Fe-S oxidoreductase
MRSRTPTQNAEPVDQAAETGETMMMGLRLVQEGASSGFRTAFCHSLETVFGSQIAHLITVGLLEWHGRGVERALRLTVKGRLLGNQVFLEFI